MSSSSAAVLFAKVAKQLAALEDDLGQLTAATGRPQAPNDNDDDDALRRGGRTATMLAAAAAGLSSAMHSIKALEEAIGRETNMERRLASKT